MGMRSCALEPRSEMQGRCARLLADRGDEECEVCWLLADRGAALQGLAYVKSAGAGRMSRDQRSATPISLPLSCERARSPDNNWSEASCSPPSLANNRAVSHGPSFIEKEKGGACARRSAIKIRFSRCWLALSVFPSIGLPSSLSLAYIECIFLLTLCSA